MSIPTEKILFYEDGYYMLSPFSAHVVDINGKRYMTAEHAYQAFKFDDEEIHEKVRNAKSPIEAKHISHAHKKFMKENYSEIKVSVMEDIYRQKALQHKDVMDKLLESGNTFIGENSPVDYFWGVGADGSGENWIGKIWMKLREEFRDVQTKN